MMGRIALRSLFHDRAKLIGAVIGVGFAAMLLLVELGIYTGFMAVTSDTVTFAGGDLWIMANSVELVEQSVPISDGAANTAAGHPCVERVRPIVMSWALLQKKSGARGNVFVIGFEPKPGGFVTWTLADGLPQDLHGPDRVAVDVFELPHLQVDGNRGDRIELNGRSVYLVATTRGLRSFTLVPYVFAELETARDIVGMGSGQASYYAVDLRDPSCGPEVIRTVERQNPEVNVRTADEFKAMTQKYWVSGSGVGAVLGFSAFLGLAVGAIIVAQTLHGMVKDHERELATLKALGATPAELASFVAYQAAFLASAGGGVGLATAWGAKTLLGVIGLRVLLSSYELGLGLSVVAGVCALASLGGMRKVLLLDASEVLK